MAYIYNSRNGLVLHGWELPPGMETLYLKSGTGWHGPFDNQAAVNKYYDDNKAANPGWKAPTDYSGAVSNTPSAIASTADAATKGLGLTNNEIQSWLIRIGEILLGIVLVGVGIAKLTGTSNIIAGLAKVPI